MYAPVPSETQESQRRAGFLSENEHRLATSHTGPHGRMGKDLSSVPGSSQPIEPAASEKLFIGPGARRRRRRLLFPDHVGHGVVMSYR